jgi:hypothetical protein
MDWIGLGKDRQVAGACECDNEPSGFIKCGEFLDWLQTDQLLKKDCAVWSKKVIKYLKHTVKRLMLVLTSALINDLP